MKGSGNGEEEMQRGVKVKVMRGEGGKGMPRPFQRSSVFTLYSSPSSRSASLRYFGALTLKLKEV